MGRKSIKQFYTGVGEDYHVGTIDKTTGYFSFNDGLFPAIEGVMLGIVASESKSYGQRILSILISDNGEIFKINIKFYAWATFFFLNSLLNTEKDDIVELVAHKNSNGSNVIEIKINKFIVKWKYNWDEMGIHTLYDQEKIDRRDHIINYWYYNDLLPWRYSG